MRLGTTASRPRPATRVLLRILCVFAALCGAPGLPPARSASADAAPSQDRADVLWAGGRLRRYLLHAPPHPPAHGAALVIVLHGHGGSARQVRRISGMNAVADREGFFVAYPEGTGWLHLHRSWNAGMCCGYAMNKPVDDVAFLRVLIDAVLQAYPVDSKRIYVTGISNGGMMAYRAGCELSDRVAAIAPVAGALDDASCHPAQPVAVVVFHGTADTYVPYAGGHGASVRDARVDPPVAAAVAFWAAHDRCAAPPEVREHGHIREETYAGGASGTEVVLYTVNGGGHAWPGGERGWRFGDAPTTELSATEEMWEFFKRHPKP